MTNKYIEKERYDERAKILLQKNSLNNFKTIPSYLEVPYKFYFQQFKNFDIEDKILEIGAGIGQNTKQILDMSFNVCATDISPFSIKILNKNFSKYKNFSSQIADMEELPFIDNDFDVICCAGSLSYGDNDKVIDEIYRVVKPGGSVIIVDSLNHNPLYKFNRFMHYLRNRRSKSTLNRMADINLINKYEAKFGESKVYFFGSITWIFPILKIMLSDSTITNISNWIDKKFKIKKSAFKFVLVLKKKDI